MKADVKTILKAVCRRSKRNKNASRDEHFDMTDVDHFLQERQQQFTIEHKQEPQIASVQTESNPTTEKRIFKSASLSDILGFNPNKPVQKKGNNVDIPSKWRTYYDKLISLKSSIESGQDVDDHMLVSNPKEVLLEIDAAIERMKQGTYGICEITGKPILEQRLNSIPYTRYSLEGQNKIEEIKRMRLLAQKMANQQRISDDDDNSEEERPFYENDGDQDLETELEEWKTHAFSFLLCAFWFFS